MGGIHHSGGHGMFRAPETGTIAHRYSWHLHRGPIPDGMHVLHTCDVACCVNPDHLYLGTHNDNMRDMVQRGRQARVSGEQNGWAKLTADQVHEIIASNETSDVLAARYGVVNATIWKVRKGENWRWLNAIGWQSIDTAPRGEMFIYYEPRDGMRCIGLAYLASDGGWRDSEGEWSRRLNPTHWMPLPEPPAAHHHARAAKTQPNRRVTP